MANLAGRDLRSTTGRNLKLLEEYTGIDKDKWRVNYLFKLLGQMQVIHYIGDEDEEKRLADLIDSLCVN